ncbi:Stomatin-like protein 2, mitochondrial [Orchesella cincta]|uniref:Stomatin-like protein 2, mitochondrial n=1 Tax=Orchesella cincta TaxID=48709 RepID=A0A1D2M6J3_ORCCI|nr:Stomatin-like protein 2, mitochondrial [Orchesella cincta]
MPHQITEELFYNPDIVQTYQLLSYNCHVCGLSKRHGCRKEWEGFIHNVALPLMVVLYLRIKDPSTASYGVEDQNLAITSISSN